ncbi:rubrerythrin-like domain-containing protein [Halococcus hamelinensis]|nr:rubrerythrin-like domain-containing protein [Halococcus hamelinensis]
MWNVGYDPEGTSEYECLRCGELVLGESHPGDCPQCHSMLRNRSMSFE